MLTGGVVGQVFLAAKGLNLGKPNRDVLEKKQLTGLLPGIKELLKKYPDKIKTPEDVAVEINGKRKEITTKELPTNYTILDIGTRTVEAYGKLIEKAKSIVVSGPMGAYENREFSFGTEQVLEKIADSKAFSLAGGGHTIAAIEEFKLTSKISYISTAGGALTEFLMGKKLPGVAALEKAAA
jgi:phosphoglycerate kinase